MAWIFALVLALTGPPAEVQTTATLVGQVVDATAGRLAGVRITVTNAETAAVRSTTSKCIRRWWYASQSRAVRILPLPELLF